MTKGTDMREYVLIKSISGDKQISCRELSIEEYYDGDVVEIDDRDFILSNKVDRVEMTMFFKSETVTWINYYKDGNLYRHDDISNGEITTEYLGAG